MPHGQRPPGGRRDTAPGGQAGLSRGFGVLRELRRVGPLLPVRQNGDVAPNLIEGRRDPAPVLPRSPQPVAHVPESVADPPTKQPQKSPLISLPFFNRCHRCQ